MKYKIVDVVDIIDGDRGSNYPKQDEFFNSGYCLFLDTGNVRRDGFSFEETHFITEEKCNALRKGKMQKGDIAYTTRGTVGNAAYFNDSVPFEHIRINSGMVILRAKSDKVISSFLYQLIKHDSCRTYIKGYCTGSAQPQLPIKNFSQIEIDIPPLAKQERISSVMTAYDSLIENNQKQIKLLEEAAQRLYKEWFVDLHFPGYENTPVVDGVPEGWKSSNINEIMTFHRGYDLTKNEMVSGDYPVVGSTSIIGYHNEYKIKGPGIVTGRSGSLGTFQLIWDDFWPHNTSLYISDFKDHHPLFLYCLLQKYDFSTLNNGGAIPTLNRNTLSNLAVIEPPAGLQQKFAEFVEPIFASARNLGKQIERLTEARDVLLPKLMSGEMEV